MLSGYLRSILVGGSLALAMVLGLSVSMRSWDGMVYFYTPQNERNPAAIRRVFDFSNLEGRALVMASQERLMADARVITNGDEVGVELGHFVAKGAGGGKEFACRTYDRIEMKFTSAETANSGEPATMTVRGPCRIARDINRIDPIWIPVQKIVHQKAGNVELQFFENEPVSVLFENMGDEWPMSWNLNSVRLFNSAEPSLQVQVERTVVEKLSRNPIRLSWKESRVPAQQANPPGTGNVPKSEPNPAKAPAQHPVSAEPTGASDQPAPSDNPEM